MLSLWEVESILEMIQESSYVNKQENKQNLKTVSVNYSFGEWREEIGDLENNSIELLSWGKISIHRLKKQKIFSSYVSQCSKKERGDHW